jgi:hypothetical protein
MSITDGLGSGVLISNDALTAAHVVQTADAALWNSLTASEHCASQASFEPICFAAVRNNRPKHQPVVWRFDKVKWRSDICDRRALWHQSNLNGRSRKRAAPIG